MANNPQTCLSHGSLFASTGGIGVGCRSRGFAERGIDFPQVAAQAGQPDADPEAKKAEGQKLNAKGNAARALSAFSLQPSAFPEHASDGELQFTLPDVLKFPPISHRGNVNGIIGKFRGVALATNHEQLNFNPN